MTGYTKESVRNLSTCKAVPPMDPNGLTRGHTAEPVMTNRLFRIVISCQFSCGLIRYVSPLNGCLLGIFLYGTALNPRQADVLGPALALIIAWLFLPQTRFPC
ncbi:hypothetical protein BJ546DRAFT_989612 [Cryomyces antarcticus]